MERNIEINLATQEELQEDMAEAGRVVGTITSWGIVFLLAIAVVLFLYDRRIKVLEEKLKG